MRLILADDHQLFRHCLRAWLESEGYEIVAECGTGEAVLEAAQHHPADLILMDLFMPLLNGIETTRRLREQPAAPAVLAVSQATDRQSVSRVLEAGAHGYVVKGAARDQLREAIEAVRHGQRYLSPEVTEGVIQGAMTAAATASESPLGPREREVLQLLAEGYTSPQIAAKLHVSGKTVEAHRRNIMRKVGRHTVAELTKYAVREGLTGLEE
jgi:two-component system NarL family response regulator